MDLSISFEIVIKNGLVKFVRCCIEHVHESAVTGAKTENDHN